MVSPASADPAPSELVVMSEDEFAAVRLEEGATVVEHKGRFWCQTYATGFFAPIHQLARFHSSEIQRPTWQCWGYRAALVPQESAEANGAIPVHVMEDLPAFSETTFDESRRRDLRKCRRQVEIRRILDPEPFLRDGYGVYRSSQERAPFGRTIDETNYRARMTARAPDRRRLLIGGFIDDRLGGYLESFALDGILYGRELYVHSDVLHTGIATGLYFDTINIAVRAGTISTICLGPEILGKPGLGWFKRGMGFPVVAVPARVQIPRPIRVFMRARRPSDYHRITGGGPPS